MFYSIQLPFFPGFYETDYKNSDTACWAIKEELDYYRRDLRDEHPEFQYLTENDLDFNDEEYDKDVIDAFVNAFAYRAPEFVLNVEYDFLSSPRYYNYRNDELFANVELADDWKDRMRHFMAENWNWLKDRIAEDWTSYDGFMSFMENDIDEWMKPLFEEEDVRYISSMIAYMMYLDNKDIRNDLLMDTMEDLYAGSYVFITDEAKDRLQSMIDNGEVVLPDPAQLTLDFQF